MEKKYDTDSYQYLCKTIIKKLGRTNAAHFYIILGSLMEMKIDSINIHKYFYLLKRLFSHISREMEDNEFDFFSKFVISLIPCYSQDLLNLFRFIFKTSKHLLTSYMIYGLFRNIYKENQYDQPTLELLILLFYRMNKPSFIRDKIVVQDTEELKGIRTIWNIAFGEVYARNYLCKLYSNSESSTNRIIFVQKCMKYMKATGGLQILLNFIHVIEDDLYKPFYRMDENKYNPDELCVGIKTKGSYMCEMRIPKNSKLRWLKERIAFEAKKDKTVVLSLNGINVDEKNFHIEENQKYHVDFGCKIRKTSIEYFPTTILSREDDFSEIEKMMHKKGSKAKAAYDVLNLVPTIEDELEIVNSDREETKWKEVFNKEKPYYTLYRINIIGNKLKDADKNWVKWFVQTGGARALLDYVFQEEKAPSIYSDDDDFIILLSVAKLLITKSKGLKHVVNEKLAKRVIQWALHPSSIIVLEILLLIVKEIEQIDLLLFINQKYFQILFQNCIFHSNHNIRRLIVSIIPAKKYYEQMISILPQSNNEMCDEYFSLLINMTQTIPNYMPEYETVRNCIINNFLMPSHSVIEQLEFKQPGLKFTTGIFTTMSIIAKRMKRIPYEVQLFDFILNNVVFNPLKFYKPINGMFETLDVIIQQNYELSSKILPKLSLNSKEVRKREEGEIKFDNLSPGLINLGATCYMNASIQQLFNVPEFRNQILKAHFEDEDQNIKSLQFLISKLMYFPTSYVDPSPFVLSWKWYDDEPVSIMTQQDAVEFIQALIDKISSKLPSIETIFQGSILHATDGLEVEYHSENIEPFITFPVDVKNMSSLEESIETILEPFMMTEENQYQTEENGKIDAKRTSRILKAPTVLIIQLKRFTYNVETEKSEKINSRFEYPFELDLAPIMKTDHRHVMYDLIGVENHIGDAGGGHYYSYVGRTKYEWYQFNDTRVEAFDQTKLLECTAGGIAKDESWCGQSFDITDNAYLLFYRKRNVETETHVSIDPSVLDELTSEIHDRITKHIIHDDIYTQFLLRIAQNSEDKQFVYQYLTETLQSQNLDTEFYLQILQTLSDNLKGENRLSDNFLSLSSLHTSYLLLNDDAKIRYQYAKIVSRAIDDANNTESYMKYILDVLPSSISHYENYDEIFQPLVHLLETKAVDNKEIIEALLYFLKEVLPNEDETIYECIKLNAIFDSLRLLCSTKDLMKKYADEILVSSFLSPLFLSQHNSISLSKLLLHFFEVKKKYFKKFIKEIKKDAMTQAYKGSTLSGYFSVIAAIKHNSTIKWIFQFLDGTELNYNLDFLKCFITRVPSMIKETTYLLIHYQQWVKLWLFSPSEKIRSFGCKLLYTNFPQFPPLGVEGCEDSVAHIDKLIKVAGVLAGSFTLLEQPLNEKYIDIMNWVLKRSKNVDALIDNSKNIIKTLIRLQDDLVLEFIAEHIRSEHSARFFKKTKIYRLMINNYKFNDFEALLQLTPPEHAGVLLDSPLFGKIIRVCFADGRQSKLFGNICLNCSDPGRVASELWYKSNFNANIGNRYYVDLSIELLENHPELAEIFSKLGCGNMVLKTALTTRNSELLLLLCAYIEARPKKIKEFVNDLLPKVKVMITSQSSISYKFMETIFPVTPEAKDLVIEIIQDGFAINVTNDHTQAIRLINSVCYNMEEEGKRKECLHLMIGELMKFDEINEPSHVFEALCHQIYKLLRDDDIEEKNDIKSFISDQLTLNHVPKGLAQLDAKVSNQDPTPFSDESS